MRRALILGAVWLVPATGAPAASPEAAGVACADSTVHPANTSVVRASRATVCLINRERARADLPALRYNRALTLAAYAHARDMVRRRFFAHGNFVSRIRRFGYLRPGDSWTAGENIAWGAGSTATPARIFAVWMSSRGHRANILSPRFRDLGLGVALGSPTGRAGGATYAANFGRRD